MAYQYLMASNAIGIINPFSIDTVVFRQKYYYSVFEVCLTKYLSVIQQTAAFLPIIQPIQIPWPTLNDDRWWRIPGWRPDWWLSEYSAGSDWPVTWKTDGIPMTDGYSMIIYSDDNYDIGSYWP